MEHIRQYDWCSSQPETNFLNEDDLDNCVVERIIRNKFHDPMISSDSEEEQARAKPKINWDEVFKRKDNNLSQEGEFRQHMYIAGFHKIPPPYPKLSALTINQHQDCLKVLCAQNPNVLATMFMPKPKRHEYKVFEETKTAYLNEQKEYKEWAKTLWSTKHNTRALRPKPITENVYEAEFKMRESRLQSFPKNFEMAAHIALTDSRNRCEIVFKQDLVKVNVADLPKVEIQEPLTRKLLICKASPVPEPCNKHPCWFILPKLFQAPSSRVDFGVTIRFETDLKYRRNKHICDEKCMTVLPLTEIHRELSQFALENNTQIITSEGALKCLVEMDRNWTIPLSVCEAISLDGDKRNVLVLGSEFSIHRKSAMERTHKAFRHLLEYALIPLSEQAKLMNKENYNENGSGSGNANNNDDSWLDVSSDDDDDHLVINDDINIVGDDDDNDNDEPALTIDEDEPEQNNESPKKNSKTDKMDEENEQDEIKTTSSENTDKTNNDKERNKMNNDKKANKIISEKRTDDGKTKDSSDFYSCSCKDSMFENPPPRSFRKWQVTNNKNGDTFDMIVHCSHKMKGSKGEVITEPIVEYQIDLGGSKQSDDKIKSLALSLLLRENASLVNARVDNGSGEVVTLDVLKLDDLTKKQPNIMADVSNIIFGTLSQLQSLLPGHYILEHEVNHGANALLYTAKMIGDGQKLTLNFDCSVLAEADEAKSVKTPPVLTDVLLPIHKYRKILPLAFTPYQRMLAKETKKPPNKTKPPPQALRWPKRKKKKKNRNNA